MTLGTGFFARDRLRPRCRTRTAGFTVNTPSARVVDLGTEFAVAVEKTGQSEIHVFVGSVTVQPQSGQPQTGHGRQSSPAPFWPARRFE